MNFYKITNQEETHNGLRYHDGLNVDPIPFSPDGDCVPGGIYFAREDILAFIQIGPWIRTVTIPEDAQMVENPGRPPRKWRADRVELGPRRRVDVEVVRELLDEGANIHAGVGEERVLTWASENGHLGLVRLLLDRGANVHAGDDQALTWASENGHLEVVRLLLDRGANIHAGEDYALRWASHNGRLEVVRELLDRGAEIHARNDEALRFAKSYGHLEVVELLRGRISQETPEPPDARSSSATP